jgi:hypothetical protein
MNANADTRDYGDQVVIVRDNGPSTYSIGVYRLPSWRKGGIAKGQDDARSAIRYDTRT